jgi:hypothetical protein
MNPNYSRLYTNLAGNRIQKVSSYQGSLPLLLLKPVQSKDIKSAELVEDDLLICYPTVLGFSFGKKV